MVRAPLFPRKFGLALNYLSFALIGALVGIFAYRRRFDAVFVYEPSPITVVFPAICLKWLGRGPVALWVQDLWPESLQSTGAVQSPWLLKLAGRLVDFLYRHCDLILGQSAGFVEAIANRGVARSKLKVLPNSAEEFYRPVAPSPAIEANLPRGFRILFAGNMGVAQDLGTVLKAAEILRDQTEIQWILVGDGRERASILKTIHDRGLTQVHWMGAHAVESMPEWLSSADALLVTLRDEPNFALTVPGKVQSYLACAKPVIAALRGEGKAVIEEAKCGLVVEPQNPDQLAHAVLKLKALAPEQRLQLGANGRAYFEANFDGHALIRRLEHWLEDLGRQPR